MAEKKTTEKKEAVKKSAEKKSVAKKPAEKKVASKKVALYKNTKSVNLFKKAVNLIPTGIPGHLGPVQSQFIPTNAFPFYCEKTQGSYFWDIDGNKYLDYMCAYGPNILGYHNKVVDAAAMAQLKMGDCMPLPGKAQVELAEMMCDTIEIADWAFFLKNGGDSTTFAVMVARAATGRDKIIRVNGGYHGVAGWTQSAGAPGVTDADVVNNIMVPWDDIAAVQRAIEENPGEIAAFISTPYDHAIFRDNSFPSEGYWQAIQKLCNNNGIVLIIDDVRCGFRLDMAGSAKFFGFEPDLACYCKAIANGYNISAVVGKDSLKSAASKVFFTGSYWSSAVPMAAGVACIKELKRLKADKLLLKMGAKLCDGLTENAKNYGIDFRCTGATSMPYFRIANDDSLMMHQEFCAGMTQRGIFIVSHHNHFMNCSLTDADIKHTLEVADDVFALVAKNNPDKLMK